MVGELRAPYGIVLEGSVPDESIARACGGYRSAMGVEGEDPWTAQPVLVTEWIRIACQPADVYALGKGGP